MAAQKQIFQTSSRLRWNTFKWFFRLVLVFIILMIPVWWIAMAVENNPLLPGLSKSEYIKNTNPAQVKGFNKKEKKKYTGYEEYMKLRQQSMLLSATYRAKHVTSQIRAAFFVDWDPQALYSLESHINRLNMVMPEWFFIDPDTDTLRTDISIDADTLMKSHGIRILPILNNVNINKQDGNFDPKLLAAVLNDPKKRKRLVDDIVKTIEAHHFQGINIDFEEMQENTIGPMHLFQKELYSRLHKKGLLVTQDIMPDNEDYHLHELGECNDYLFLMAYDQHYGESVPGSISDQHWIEMKMDEMAQSVPPEKVVLCLAGFGYDWAEGSTGTTISYPEALSIAKQFNATIDFDNDSYNCVFQYNDYNNVHHQVYFMDAAGNFNTMRFADEYGTAGVAMWRLGSEDERIWKFYNRDLSNAALKKTPFDYSLLSTLNITTENPDYINSGEVLDVLSEPEPGEIKIETDSIEGLISEQTYQQLPTRYVIQRFGEVVDIVKKNNKVDTTYRALLTFDDGPDPDYTPRILDILEKEKVPAAFFVVGINAENHLPILKRIYHDGFEIGNHTFTHPNIANVSMSRANAEMEATRLLIESATGHSTILFRAPYNADAEPTKAVELKPVARAKQNSYYTVGESIDPSDWDTEDGLNADSVYNRVVREYESNPKRDKGIILLHDAGGNREATVEALPRIIQYFKSHNVKLITVAELLKLPKDAIMPPVHNDLVNMNSVVSIFVYWTGRFLFAAFWVAILLGLTKIFIMSILAMLQNRRSKKEALLPVSLNQGKVSIIVPAYNEEINAVKTVHNLLLQDYADYEIIFVDDGSKDNTYAKVSAAFEGHQRVRVFTKPNAGKASALNFGIERSNSDYVVCIDADTQLMPDAVRLMMKYFTDARVVAVAGNVKVGNEKNILTKWQAIEYTTAQNFDRLAFDYLNCITVVPGAIGAFKKSSIMEAGGFTTDTLAEDCDLSIRLLRTGGVIRNCPQAIAVTEAPETLKQFMRQRFRWSYGIMQSFWKNRDACFNPQYKTLGMVALPNILLFQVIMTLFAPFADLLFFFSIGWSWHDPESLHKLIFFYGLFLVVDVIVSVMAFSFEKEKYYKLLWLVPQRFVYRQLMYVVLFRSIRKAIKGEVQGWGVLKRTGNVALGKKV